MRVVSWIAARRVVTVLVTSVLATSLGGCAGDGVAEPRSPLVVQIVEPPGPHCAAGGTVVVSGVDRDASGALEEAEISGRSYVCNAVGRDGRDGEDGRDGDDGRDGTASRSLFRVEPEAAGAHCAGGGLALKIGTDANGDGVLGDNEIAQTRYVCSGADGADGADGVGPLVRIDDEPPGRNCTEGGVAIRVGVDTNRDGVLGDSEVAQTRFACRDADGAATLVRIDDVTAGARCSAGGVIIQTGRDRNGNGALDDSEIAQSRDVCRGTDGSSPRMRVTDEPRGERCAEGGKLLQNGIDTNRNGQLDDAEVTDTQVLCNGIGGSGLNPVLRMDDEPAGPNCADGGTAVRVGIDGNGNHVLDDVEVTGTSYLCTDTTPHNPPIVFGHIHILSQLDVSQVVGVREVTGNVIVDAPGLPAIDLSALERVGGDLMVNPGTTMPTFDLPNLTSVGGRLMVSSDTIRSFALPRLKTIGGDLTVERTSETGGIAAPFAPVLESVGWSLHLTGADLLPHAFDRLATVGYGLSMNQCSQAGEALSFPALTALPGDLRLDGNRFAGGGVRLPALTAIGGELWIGSNDFTGGALQISGVKATGGTVRVLHNRFGSIGLALPELDLFGTVEIVGNDLTGGTVELARLARAYQLTFVDNAFSGGVLALPALNPAENPYLSLRVVIRRNGLASISLPQLVATYELLIEEDALHVLDLSALERTARVTLAGIDVPALELARLRLTSEMTIRDAGIQSVSAPHLEGRSDGDGVGRLSRLTVTGCPALTSLQFPLVYSLRSLVVSDNNALVRLSGLSALRGVSTLIIDRNQRLTDLDLSLYNGNETIAIRDNPSLPTCKATTVPGDCRFISGNLADACAPPTPRAGCTPPAP